MAHKIWLLHIHTSLCAILHIFIIIIQFLALFTSLSLPSATLRITITLTKPIEHDYREITNLLHGNPYACYSHSDLGTSRQLSFTYAISDSLCKPKSSMEGCCLLWPIHSTVLVWKCRLCCASPSWKGFQSDLLVVPEDEFWRWIQPISHRTIVNSYFWHLHNRLFVPDVWNGLTSLGEGVWLEKSTIIYLGATTKGGNLAGLQTSRWKARTKIWSRGKKTHWTTTNIGKQEQEGCLRLDFFMDSCQRNVSYMHNGGLLSLKQVNFVFSYMCQVEVSRWVLWESCNGISAEKHLFLLGIQVRTHSDT